MIQASWKGRKFEVSEKRIAPMSRLETSIAVKKKDDATKGQSTVQGHELQTFAFEYVAVHEAGCDPRAEFAAWEAMLGQYAPLQIGSRRFGPAYIQLQRVSMDDFTLDAFGNFRTGTIRLEFTEYATGKAGTTGKNGLKIIYKGKDIFPNISVHTLVHTMYGESQADDLTLTFNDTSRRWDGWHATNEETIEVSQGAGATGIMWIHDVKPENGRYTLKASSVPPTFRKRTSKSWEGVTFEQICKEIAGRHGLTFAGYDVPAVTYEYVCQNNDEDFIFLNTRCKLEGCSFLVYSKKLIVYGERLRESVQTQTTLSIGPKDKFTYTDNTKNSFCSAEVVNAGQVGRYTAPSGAGSQVLHKTITIPMNSQGEADRFAQNLLRHENKNQRTGVAEISIRRELAPGSVVTLKTTGAASFDGPVFVTRIRNDYKRLTSKIWVRQCLKY